MSEYLEGSKMDAPHGCTELQIMQNSAVTSDPLMIQNEEWKKEESQHLYSIPNPTHTSRTDQIGQPYQGNVKHAFLKVRITILLFTKMI